MFEFLSVYSLLSSAIYMYIIYVRSALCSSYSVIKLRYLYILQFNQNERVDGVQVICTYSRIHGHKHRRHTQPTWYVFFGAFSETFFQISITRFDHKVNYSVALESNYTEPSRMGKYLLRRARFVAFFFLSPCRALRICFHSEQKIWIECHFINGNVNILAFFPCLSAIIFALDDELMSDDRRRPLNRSIWKMPLCRARVSLTFDACALSASFVVNLISQFCIFVSFPESKLIVKVICGSFACRTMRRRRRNEDEKYVYKCGSSFPWIRAFFFLSVSFHFVVCLPLPLPLSQPYPTCQTSIWFSVNQI